MNQFLLRAASDEMKRMSSITEETIGLSILLGIQLVRLTIIPGKHSLRVHEDDDENGRQSLLPLAAGQKRCFHNLMIPK